MIRKILDSIAYRTVRRYNVIKIRDLEPNYYDKDTILLHGIMQVLVDYVEIELASVYNHQCAKSELNLKERLHSILHWRLRSAELIRSREKGLKVLDYMIKPHDDILNVEESKSSMFAKQVKDVYIWWKELRPRRRSPEVESGYMSIYNILVKKYGKSFSVNHLEHVEKREYKNALSKLNMVEVQQLHEDKEHMKKVVQFSNHLWT